MSFELVMSLRETISVLRDRYTIELEKEMIKAGWVKKIEKNYRGQPKAYWYAPPNPPRPQKCYGIRGDAVQLFLMKRMRANWREKVCMGCALKSIGAIAPHRKGCKHV